MFFEMTMIFVVPVFGVMFFVMRLGA